VKPRKRKPRHHVKPKNPKRPGRPTDYDPALLPKLVKALESGQTQATAAQRVFGVVPQTFCEWKLKYAELREAVKKGEARYWEAAEDNIERVSVAAAIGRLPKTISEERDANGHLTGERVIEYFPSSAADRFFILCNKRPDKWQNVQRVEVKRTGEGPHPLVFVIDRGDGQDRRVAVGGGVVEALPESEAPKALEAETSETETSNE